MYKQCSNAAAETSQHDPCINTCFNKRSSTDERAKSGTWCSQQLWRQAAAETDVKQDCMPQSTDTCFLSTQSTSCRLFAPSTPAFGAFLPVMFT